VVLYDRVEQKREACPANRDERGLRWWPPFDHPHIIAGQGTAALETADGCALTSRLLACADRAAVGIESAGAASPRTAAAPGLRVIGSSGHGPTTRICASKRRTHSTPQSHSVPMVAADDAGRADVSHHAAAS